MSPQDVALTADQLLERESAATRAFLAPETFQFAGVNLRPTTLATFTMLQETGNEYLHPAGPLVEIPDPAPEAKPGAVKKVRTIKNDLFAALAFAYIHGEDENTVRRAIWNPVFFREEVLRWGNQFDLSDLPALVGEIRQRLALVNQLKIAIREKPSPKASPDDPTPPPNSSSPA